VKKLFIMLLLVVGCISAPYILRDYTLGIPLQANVGSLIMGWTIQRPPFVGFRQELLYSGFDGEVVYVSYREYSLESSEAYARPAYYQELRYNIRQSALIRFRDIGIRIDSANSQMIAFTILSEPQEVTNVQASINALEKIGFGTRRADSSYVQYPTPRYAKIELIDGDLLEVFVFIKDAEGYTVSRSLTTQIFFRVSRAQIFKIKWR
jgi:hypothetical protein